jgi:phosphatidylinositol glycan class B
VLEHGYLVTSRRRGFAGGALLGLVLVIRVHLASALIIVALWTNWRAGRERLMAVLAGVAVVVAAAGALDTLTLGYPLASVWRYLVYNLYYGVSSTFGVEPWWYYLVGELGVWRRAGATMLLLAAVGAWRLPLLPILVITIVGVHSGIAHKEYRFIYPAIMLVTVLGAVGLTQLAMWARDWLIDRGTRETVAALASMALAVGWWGLASLQVWTGTTLTFYRLHMHDRLAAASYVAHKPAPCGIGLYGLAGNDWTDYGGYTYFHRPAPMHWPKDEPGLIAAAAGFDTLLYTKPPPPELGFTTSRCIGEVCIAQRAGGCRAQPTTPLPVPAALQALASGAASAPAVNGIGRE